MGTVAAPTSDLELYSDDALLDPYPRYQELRDLGGAVRLEAYGLYTLSRFADCREALRNWPVFSSAQGVMMNDLMNQTLIGIVLCADGEEHAAMRKVIGGPLTPRPSPRCAPRSTRRRSASSSGSSRRAPSTPPPSWRTTCRSPSCRRWWGCPRTAASTCSTGPTPTSTASGR